MEDEGRIMTTLKPIHKADLKKLKLDKGVHDSPDKGMCLMEAVAFLRGQPFNDHPACVSLSLGSGGRSLNDCLPDDKRQELIQFIPRIVGTAGDGKEERRAWIALDWMIRVYTPAFLRLVPGLVPYADAIESLNEIRDETTVRLAMEKITPAQKKSAAACTARAAAENSACTARAAAYDAARAAACTAWTAAENSAWAARDAAYDAACTAAENSACTARAAAYDAARAAACTAWTAAENSAWAARDAAYDAACTAACTAWTAAENSAWAARAAAWDSAWTAAWTARAAAWYAAGYAAGYAVQKFLAPTVAKLQDSSIELYGRLIEAK
jgi:hypothetical protein